MGRLLTRLPRLTLAQLRTLRSTTVCTCHRDLRESHSPDGKIANVLALITLFAGWWFSFRKRLSVNRELPDLLQHSYLCARSSSKVPITPMVDSRFAPLFAGWRCCCQWRLSVNRELPDLLQHSCLCARSSSKVPIAPMGDSNLLVVCRAAVSMSRVAQWPSQRAP